MRPRTSGAAASASSPQDLHAEAEARARLEQDLRDAIAQGDLQLYYQPVVSTATERIAGFEALLRWHHPQRGWIPTEKFIKIAEDTGLIAQIGEWALRTACHDLAKWPEDVRVAVNVSPLQFANPQLPAIVTSASPRPASTRRGSSSRSPRACSSPTTPTPTRCSRRSSASACGSRSTISAPAIPRSAI